MTALATLDSVRQTPPGTTAHLAGWVRAYTGVRVAASRVCRHHAPPLEWMSSLWFDRPAEALVLGSRGSGKSFLSSILTHMESRFTRGTGTRILGGSESQSAQIHEGVTQAVIDGRGPGGSDRDTIAEMYRKSIIYRNGSQVAILPASEKSVRGPHVPSLRLDEVDEIDGGLRESAMGMCMGLYGLSACVTMTSTWHRVGGPMTELVERGRAGDFPLWTTCTFDVLEACPDSRSGRFVGGADLYERCPACPIQQWCHAERDANGDRALAKLSSGHYQIDALIQKVHTVSVRTFESDYLCLGPKAEGLWFTGFHRPSVVDPGKAEYDPNLPVHLAIDCGIYTGAVAFQVRRGADARPSVSVFWDYLREGGQAREHAAAILEGLAGRNGTGRRVTCDNAGWTRQAVGPAIIAEYHTAGLTGIERWNQGDGSVNDSLALVEAFLSPASGGTRLFIHPRCKDLVAAFENYRRAKVGVTWQDYPAKDCHPWEDLIDPLRSGLRIEFPEGLRKPAEFRRVSPARMAY